MNTNNIFNKFSKTNNPIIKIPISNYKILNSKLSQLTSKILNRDFNYQNIKCLETLNNNELILLQNEFAKKYQKNLYKLFKNLILKQLKKHYLKIDYENFRVGMQIKSKWNKKNANFNRKVYYDKFGVLHESRSQENFCFPTRPHQDLSNNGYRGSGILIFYYQASCFHKDQSIMIFARPSSKVKILKYSKKSNYGNQIDDKVYKSLYWYLDKNLNNKNLIIMDPYTIHSSSKISEVPRIAFNIKIQPSNYLFIFGKDLKSFQKKLKECKNEIEKIRFFYEVIKFKSKENNRLNFELAVLSKLLNNNIKMKQHFNKILSFKPSKNTIQEFLCGAFLRIIHKDITNNNLKLIKNKNPKIVKYSCAYNLLNTIGLTGKFLKKYNSSN